MFSYRVLFINAAKELSVTPRSVHRVSLGRSVAPVPGLFTGEGQHLSSLMSLLPVFGTSPCPVQESGWGRLSGLWGLPPSLDFLCSTGPGREEEFPGLLVSPSCLPVRIKVSGLMLVPADFVLASSGISSGNLLAFTLSFPPLLLDTRSD